MNAAEGEPATFKDRLLMRLDPYRVIEGAAIAAFAVSAATIYIATKRQYAKEVDALRRAAVSTPISRRVRGPFDGRRTRQHHSVCERRRQ